MLLLWLLRRVHDEGEKGATAEQEGGNINVAYARAPIPHYYVVVLLLLQQQLTTRPATTFRPPFRRPTAKIHFSWFTHHFHCAPPNKVTILEIVFR